MNILKKHRKFGLGLCLFLVLASVGVLAPRHAFALINNSQAQDCANNLVFDDIAHISCKVDGFKITFVDKNPTDNNDSNDYAAGTSKYASESTPGVFCPGATDDVQFGNSAHFGIADAGSSQSANVYISYAKSNGKAGCDTYQKNGVKIKNTNGINTLLNGGSNSATSLGDLSGTNLAGLSYSRYDSGNKDNPSSGSALFVSSDFDILNSCKGSILAVYYSGTSGGTATEYDVGSSSSYDALKTKTNLNNLPDSVCGVKNLNYGLGNSGVVGISPKISGIALSQLGKTCTPGNAPDGTSCSCNVDGGNGASCTVVADTSNSAQGAANQQSSSSCENNTYGMPFAWAMCPVLDAASSLSSALIGIFEDQLSFKVSDLSSSSQGAASGESEVKASWAMIRDIASSLLVLIMLVMVLSQAVSWGPFDAYTLKKVMPKMVIAIILMQISWDLFAYVVGLFDDIGHGLANILYLPFGGASNMDIWHLLGNAHLSAVKLTYLDWSALLVGGFLGYAFIFTMLGTATVAIFGLLAGLLTLVFRKILIIMLLILSPLALVAWILPGTATYWKMWRENFIKALSMFPIAMGIIAAGRIFAQVAGSQDNGTGGTFLNLIFVLVGYFGPLFILPKTFKWGGQAMQMAGNGVSKAGSKIAERPKKFFDARQEGWNHYRAEQSQERVAKGVGLTKQFWNYPLDKLKSGQWDPTYGRRKSDRRQRAVQSYVEKGEKSEQEAISAAESRLIRERQKYRAEGGNHDLLLQAIADGKDHFEDPSKAATNADGKYVDKAGNELANQDDPSKRVPARYEIGPRNQAQRMAARKQLAKLGAGMNWRYLENYYETAKKKGGEEAAEMRKFFDDNVETILPKLPHIYKSIGQAADADPSGIANMHGVEVEAILANLTKEIKEAKTPSERAGKIASLNTFLSNFQRAVQGSARGGGNLENGALRAVKGFLTNNDIEAGELLDDINYNDPNGLHGRAGHNSKPEGDPKRKGRGDFLPGEEERKLPLLHRSRDIEEDINTAIAQSSGPAKEDVIKAKQNIDSLKLSLDSMIDANGSVINANTSDDAVAAIRAGAVTGPATVSPSAATAGTAGEVAASQAAPAPASTTTNAPAARVASGVVLDPTTGRPATGAVVGTPAPTVNVNIDHEAIGAAFASHMKNVLQHTTLKIDHPDGSSGSGSFSHHDPDDSGEDGPSAPPPPTPPTPPPGGPPAGS